MTIKQLKADVKRLNPRLTLRWNPDFREFSIHLQGNEAATYFTNDADDARNTARLMATQLQ